MLAPFPCACSQMASNLNISLSISNPHISVLGPMTSSKFDRVLHSNMNNVCVPNIKSFPELFLASFCAFYDQAYFFSQKFMDPIPDAIYAPSKRIFKNKALTVFIPLFQPLIHQLFILLLISQLDQYSDSFSSNSPLPSIYRSCHAAKTLGSKLVLSAPDRNCGTSDIYCPLILWHDIFSSFWENRNFQKQLHLSIQSVFSHLKYIYAKNKWSDIGKFYSLGSLPYAYVTRKFKDLSRKRNILSYFHHPLKQKKLQPAKRTCFLQSILSASTPLPHR